MTSGSHFSVYGILFALAVILLSRRLGYDWGPSRVRLLWSISLFAIAMALPTLLSGFFDLTETSSSGDTIERSMRMIRELSSFTGGGWIGLVAQLLELFGIFTLVGAVMELREVDRGSGADASSETSRT